MDNSNSDNIKINLVQNQLTIQAMWNNYIWYRFYLLYELLEIPAGTPYIR